MGREHSITRLIQVQDSKLFCRRNIAGKLCIYREGYRWDSYILDNNCSLSVSRPTPHFVFALTHNWQEDGRPVDWGSLPILKRLKEIDLWNRDLASEIEKQEERKKASNERELRNKNEAFFSEFHSKFKEDFKDINVANLSKAPRKKKIKTART